MTNPELSSDKVSEANPIDRLHQLGGEITPGDVQKAINFLDPRSPFALQEAEDVLGWAETGTRLHPGEEDWDNIYERAWKVYQHRKGPNVSLGH